MAILAILLVALSVAIPALCVWVAIRLINWRDRPGWKFWACVAIAFFLGTVAGAVAVFVTIYCVLMADAL